MIYQILVYYLKHEEEVRYHLCFLLFTSQTTIEIVQILSRHVDGQYQRKNEQAR